MGNQKVVIVGNGVAGITVAETLRRTSELVEVTVVTDEQHYFYNRMAIGRVLYGRTAMDGLFLLPDTWYAENRIDVWRSTDFQREITGGISLEPRHQPAWFATTTVPTDTSSRLG